jgi:hypothetical protein
MRFIDNLKLKQKCMLIGTIAVLAAAIPATIVAATLTYPAPDYLKETTRRIDTVFLLASAAYKSLQAEYAAQAGSLQRQLVVEAATLLGLAVASFKLAAGSSAVAAPAAAGWDGTSERRGPDRAVNVTRPKFAPKKAAPKTAAASPAPAAEPAKTGTDDWTSF